MIGLIINRNSDVYYLPTAENIDRVYPIIHCKLGEYEEKIVKSYSLKFSQLTEIYQVVDNKLVSENNVFSLNRYSSNHLNLRFILSHYQEPRVSFCCHSYNFLKYTLDNWGVLYLSDLIDLNSISFYRVSTVIHHNDLLLDYNPVEFLLIQLGLNRIDDHIYEKRVELNTEYNSECWDRYLSRNPEIITLDEINSLSGK